MISRTVSPKIKQTNKSVLLLGPRQVGKSTLLRNLKPDLIINLADDQTYLDFKSNPSELRQLLAGGNYKTVLIDEVQRSPELLNTIQSILDEQPLKQKTKFLLSGSSARKLKRGGANLLPGRIFSYNLGPLCSAELNYNLDISKALSLGCLPEPYLSKKSDAQKLLQTYSGTYLKEEIQAEALTRDLQGFSRFLIQAAESAGQSTDFSKIAKAVKIERKNVSRFYEILTDTLIAYRIDVFKKTKSEIIKRPKFYFFDTGVLNGLLNNFVVSDDRKGTLFEHLVVSQIISSANAKDIPIELTYFRTRAGFEVDLVLEFENKVYGIEIKSGQTHQKDAEKIERFSNLYKKTNGLYIINLDIIPKKMGAVKVCDLNYFLKDVGL
jgi:predicted AAA+ superfamily ATPase